MQTQDVLGSQSKQTASCRFAKQPPIVLDKATLLRLCENVAVHKTEEAL